MKRKRKCTLSNLIITDIDNIPLNMNIRLTSDLILYWGKKKL